MCVCVCIGYRSRNDQLLAELLSLVQEDASDQLSKLRVVVVNAIHPVYAYTCLCVLSSAHVINPRRACARVTVVVLCVCVSPRL